MSGRAWFRMWSEVVDDEKLRLLAFEDRWHFVAILACKAQGILDTRDDEQMLRRKIAVKLGLQVRELEEVSRRLAEVGLICEDTLQPLKWDKRQFESDLSTDRVRKFRERNGVKRFRNVSETPPDTDTDTDTETETEEEREKPTRRANRKTPTPIPNDWTPGQTAAAYIASFNASPQAQQRAIADFIAYWRSKGDARANWDLTFVKNPVAKETLTKGAITNMPTRRRLGE